MEGKNIILDKVITLVHSIHPEMSAENVKEIHEKCDAEGKSIETHSVYFINSIIAYLIRNFSLL